MGIFDGKLPGDSQDWPPWIATQLLDRGIHDTRVLRAMKQVSRAPFVPMRYRLLAQTDGPLPIGHNQTISQPYIHALSLQALTLKGDERVLDIGTGSGYQAVLLSYLAAAVYTMEFQPALYKKAKKVIRLLGKAPIDCRCGDGRLGWPEAAPFGAIVVGAWAAQVPLGLLEQLAPGGRLVIPVGTEDSQVLYQITRTEENGIIRQPLERVRFVPLLEGNGQPND